MNPEGYRCSRTNHVKLPLGLMPKRSWEEMRKDEIKEAIKRCLGVDIAIPIEWIEELNSYSR